MATQAMITLTAVNGETQFPKRTLTLHPHLRTIQIGRASKTTSKGLQASVDNGWFDSPVMSRNHAEISLDVESNIITLQDIGSMHGTFVNKSQLSQHEPHGLSNDDLIVFGAEVKRIPETFPACVFRVNYELLPFETNTSYAFPEFDDEDDESSDNDLEDNEDASSEDNISIESPPHKASPAIHAIDLTGDESPASIVAEADPTGKTSAEKDMMAGRPADIDHRVDPVSVAIHARITPVLVDSDDEDDHFSSDSDDQSDEVEYDDGAASQRESSVDEQEDSDNGSDSDQEIDLEEEASSEPHSNQLIPELNIACTDASLNIVEVDEEEDESEFGLSDAAAEGMRALFDDELVDNAGDAVFEDIEEDIDSGRVVDGEATTAQNTKATIQLELPKHITFASSPPAQVPEMTSDYYHFNIFGPSSQSDETPSQKGMNARQPSPSDAAMVKTAAASTTSLGQIWNPIKVTHLPSQDFQNLTAQSLGEKTGKHAFFAAREDNKAKISAGENDRPRRASLQNIEKYISRGIALAKSRNRRMEEEASMMSAESAQALPTRTGNITAPSLTTLPYLDDHTQASHANHTPSPEPDMASAVTYNESKSSMASADKPMSVGRSGISISDIVERSSGEQGLKSLKRKANDISEAMEDEIRVWATSSPALNDSEGPMAPTASTSKVAFREEQSDIASNLAPETPQQRPAKRLRKLVESVGYVALGGATLFGALVLSAPDFL